MLTVSNSLVCARKDIRVPGMFLQLYTLLIVYRALGSFIPDLETA